MSDNQWTRGDRIALIGLLVSIFGLIATWVSVPGVREAVGFGAPADSAAATAEPAAAPAASARPAPSASASPSSSAPAASPPVAPLQPVRPPACTSFTACMASCEAGAFVSCAFTGDMLRNGSDGATKDSARAYELYTRACQGGELQGCANRGWLELNGDGTGKNADAALASFAMACNDTTAAGCYGVGVILRGGFGVPKDVDRAADAFGRACAAGASAGCKAKEQLQKK